MFAYFHTFVYIYILMESLHASIDFSVHEKVAAMLSQ